jgi:WD40 repeat protein
VRALKGVPSCVSFSQNNNPQSKKIVMPLKTLGRLCVSFALASVLCVFAHAQRPELVVQTGHSELMRALAFSPDGKLLASGSWDNRVKLWDVTTGRELRTLVGHAAHVEYVAFSPNGRVLASGSPGDETVRLWQIVSGGALRVLKVKLPDAGAELFGGGALHFSPDGKLLAVERVKEERSLIRKASLTRGIGGVVTEVQLWDVETGKLLRTLDEGRFIGFSADGALAVIAGEREVKVRRVTTGEVAVKLPVKSALAVVSTKAGSFVLAEERGLKLFDLSTGKLARAFEGQTGACVSASASADGATLACGMTDGSVAVWDLTTGRLVRSLNVTVARTQFVALSADGGRVLAAGGELKALSVRRWDLKTGAETGRVEVSGKSVHAAAFNLELSSVAVASGDAELALLNAETGKLVRNLTGRALNVYAVAFSADGKYLASGGWRGSLKVWGLADGTARTFAGLKGKIGAVAFSPDGRTIAAGGQDKVVKLWDVETGRELRALAGHTGIVKSIAFSPDGKLIASACGDLFLGDEAGDDSKVRVWDAATGAQLQALAGHAGRVFGVAFSPDGKTIASAGDDGTVRLWDAATGRETRRIGPEWKTSGTQTEAQKGTQDGGRFGMILSVAFSPDGATLAAGDDAGNVVLFDAATTSVRGSMKTNTSVVFALAFSPDSKSLLTANASHTPQLWDLATMRESHKLAAHTSLVASVAFNADGRLAATASPDATIKLHDARTGEELLTLVQFDGDDWLVVAPDGLFDGSPASWTQVLWRYERNTFNVAPVEWFFNEFYAPGLLADAAAGHKPPAPQDFTHLERRQPAIKLTPVGVESAGVVGTRTLKLKVEVSDADLPTATPTTTGCGAFDMRLFRNGTLVKVWRGDVLNGRRSAAFEVELTVGAGDNNLMAYAFNRENVKSTNALLTLRGAESLRRKGTAHVLAVGINQYENKDFNLRYAVADAQDFAAEIKRQLERLNTFDRVVVTTLADREATKVKIVRALAQLQTVVQPEDEVVVYFAGHGTAYKNQFYLLPHDLGYAGTRAALDEAGMRTIITRGISDRDLEQAFERIDGGGFLLVIDACNSGQALEAEEKRRGPMNSKGLAQLAYEKGMYVLTASQSFQAAQEARQLGHGLLTYALVEEGLKQSSADRAPRDGEVRAREWMDYATARVPEMQMDEMRRAATRGVNLSFADGERALNVQNRSGQRPRVFYRREIETQPLVVSRH